MTLKGSRTVATGGSEAVERVIASCDLTTPIGIRDRAVLLLLARLGLRAGDVAALKLRDLDWQAGTVQVSGKNQCHNRWSCTRTVRILPVA